MKSFVNRLTAKFRYAFEGLFHGICHDSSIRIQCGFAVLAAAAGVLFDFTVMEWIVLILAIVLVIAMEFVNSSIERLCDLCAPHINEASKRIKDYAAAAVLIVSIGALLVGLLIIGGKLL